MISSQYYCDRNLIEFTHIQGCWFIDIAGKAEYEAENPADLPKPEVEDMIGTGVDHGVSISKFQDSITFSIIDDGFDHPGDPDRVHFIKPRLSPHIFPHNLGLLRQCDDQTGGEVSPLITESQLDVRNKIQYIASSLGPTVPDSNPWSETEVERRDGGECEVKGRI